MGLYYTKCGMTFNKNSTARVTGYLIEDGNEKCMKCPFLVKKMNGYPLEFSHFECRAGSKPINYEKEFIGSLSDKNNVSVLAHDPHFTDEVIAFAKSLEGIVYCDYSSEDTEDNRRRVVVGIDRNRKGINAKKIIYDKFFEPKTHPLEGIDMIDFIASFIK